MINVPISACRQIASQIASAGHFHAGSTIHQFKSNTVPGPGDTPSTYTEADYSGYTSPAGSYLSNLIEDFNGNPLIRAMASLFAMSGTGVTENVFGFWKQDAGGTTVEFAARYPAPIAYVDGTYAIYQVGAVGFCTTPPGPDTPAFQGGGSLYGTSGYVVFGGGACLEHS